MLWFGSWEIKPYNREFLKIPKHANSKLLYAITNSYMLFAIAICYYGLLLACYLLLLLCYYAIRLLLNAIAILCYYHAIILCYKETIQ